MSYYTQTARPDMQRVSDLLAQLAQDYQSSVGGATAQMGNLQWPLMMFFCAGGYNESLRIVRDAACDIGESVDAMSQATAQIVDVYERLEQAAIVG